MERKLHIEKGVYQKMVDHAIDAYPNECCGILLGDGKRRKVTRIRKAENVFKERLRDRYSIDPKDILEAEREARKEGLEILGFYHSHPDHPPRPSSFDREMAWPFYSYIIVGVNKGKAEVRSWWMEEEGGEFKEERIDVEV